MKKIILFIFMLFISMISFSIPLNNVDKNGNVTLPNINLIDQYGKEHNLEDYKGKVVAINFWVSWCKDCKREMPDVQELYREYGENSKELIILGVVSPKSEMYPNNKDRVDKQSLLKYINENNYTFPSLFDETGEIYKAYEVVEYPSTFIIDRNGHLKAYIKGAVDKEIMKNNIDMILNK